MSMSTRTFRGPRKIAILIPIATAALVGGLVTAAPAWAVDTGEVTYSGTVTCEEEFGSKSVAKNVKLSSGEDDASGPTKEEPNKRPTYGPLKLVVPLDSSFNLKVTVSCKAPKKKMVEFTRVIAQKDLTEDDPPLSLNIK